MGVEGERRRAILALEAMRVDPARNQDRHAIEQELERLRRLERWQRIDERSVQRGG